MRSSRLLSHFEREPRGHGRPRHSNITSLSDELLTNTGAHGTLHTVEKMSDSTDALRTILCGRNEADRAVQRVGIVKGFTESR